MRRPKVLRIRCRCNLSQAQPPASLVYIDGACIWMLPAPLGTQGLRRYGRIEDERPARSGTPGAGLDARSQVRSMAEGVGCDEVWQGLNGRRKRRQESGSGSGIERHRLRSNEGWTRDAPCEIHLIAFGLTQEERATLPVDSTLTGIPNRRAHSSRQERFDLASTAAQHEPRGREIYDRRAIRVLVVNVDGYWNSTDALKRAKGPRDRVPNPRAHEPHLSWKKQRTECRFQLLEGGGRLGDPQTEECVDFVGHDFGLEKEQSW